MNNRHTARKAAAAASASRNAHANPTAQVAANTRADTIQSPVINLLNNLEGAQADLQEHINGLETRLGIALTAPYPPTAAKEGAPQHSAELLQRLQEAIERTQNMSSHIEDLAARLTT